MGNASPFTKTHQAHMNTVPNYPWSYFFFLVLLINVFSHKQTLEKFSTSMSKRV